MKEKERKKYENNFLKLAKEKWNYDYSLVEYKNYSTKINIICPIHGKYKQTCENHLKYGCPKCSDDREKEKFKQHFLNRAKEKWNNKYNYDLIEYKYMKVKVTIICPIHGKFKQRPDAHIDKGCPQCHRKQYIEKFFDNCAKLHNNKYDYSESKYVGHKTKITIICPIHGKFRQTPMDHSEGCGCPTCNSSKGELKIMEYLKDNNIKYLHEYSFQDCINPETRSVLSFDFYLPKQNIVIEYDGIQHFKPINIFGGEEGLKNRKYLDNIKNTYAKNKKNLNLLRIPYYEYKNIKEKLKIYIG